MRYVQLPPELRFIAERYNGLLSQFATTMQELQDSLNSAASLLRQERKEEALQELQHGRALLARAGALAEDIRQASDILVEATGLLKGTVAARNLQYHEQLQEALRRLQALTLDYATLHGTLTRVALGEEALPVIPTLAPRLKTVIEVEAEPKGYPGLPLSVRGKLTRESRPEQPLTPIELWLDEQRLLQLSVPSSFDVAFTPPEDATLGKHTLVVVAPAQREFAEASWKGELEIIRALPALEARSSAVVLLKRRISVSGLTSSEFGPLQGAQVTLQAGQATQLTTTGRDGGFDASLSLPWNLFLGGVVNLNIAVQPQEPWNGPVERELTLWVINVPNIALLAVVSLYLTIALNGRYLRRRHEERPTAPGEGEGVISVETPLARLTSLVGMDEGRARVLKALERVLLAAQEALQAALKPSQTLRELTMGLPLGDGRGDMAHLTSIAERALYSPYPLDDAEVLRAEDLSQKLEGGLRRASL